MFEVIERLWLQDLSRATEVEAFARPSVVFPSGCAVFRLREPREVETLGEMLIEQGVGVLDEAAPPRAVRIIVVHRDTGGLGRPSVLSHFAPLLVGHGELFLCTNPIQDQTEGRHSCFAVTTAILNNAPEC